MAKQIESNDIRALAKTFMSSGVTNDFDLALTMAEVALKKKAQVDSGAAKAAASKAAREERKARRDAEVASVIESVTATSGEIATLITGACEAPEFVKRVRLDVFFTANGWVAQDPTVSASGGTGAGGGGGRSGEEQKALSALWVRMVDNASALGIKHASEGSERFLDFSVGARQQRVTSNGDIRVAKLASGSAQSRWETIRAYVEKRATEGTLGSFVAPDVLTCDNLLSVLSDWMDSALGA
tara:strand:- start:1246 stop:1971 length:726 start_codon:yes stop_codon:yes gene_type:complete